MTNTQIIWQTAYELEFKRTGSGPDAIKAARAAVKAFVRDAGADEVTWAPPKTNA